MKTKLTPKENEEENLKEEYLNKNGWIQVEGYKIDIEKVGDYDYTYLFVEKDNELVTESVFWKDVDDDDESCFDLTDDAVEYVEDICGQSFEDFKRIKNKIKEKKE